MKENVFHEFSKKKKKALWNVHESQIEIIEIKIIIVQWKFWNREDDDNASSYVTSKKKKKRKEKRKRKLFEASELCFDIDQ